MSEVIKAATTDWRFDISISEIHLINFLYWKAIRGTGMVLTNQFLAQWGTFEEHYLHDVSFAVTGKHLSDLLIFIHALHDGLAWQHLSV